TAIATLACQYVAFNRFTFITESPLVAEFGSKAGCLPLRAHGGSVHKIKQWTAAAGPLESI
ncbi:MAG: hypothetical protein ACREUU_12020, partial [Gammaproteobacteria bacterium]